MRPLAAAIIAVATTFAPWLVWAPTVRAPAAVIVCGAIAIVGACHGYGRLLARLAGRHEVDTALAVQWGIATMIGLAGVLLAASVYDARLLLVAGSTLHTTDGLIALRARRNVWQERMRADKILYTGFPVVLLGVLSLVHVLAGAGSGGRHAYDDDTNVAAQVARLADTGALGDAIGYPRLAQLGGRMAVDGLIGAFANPRAVGMIEGLAFVLLLYLACARIRPRDATTAIWASLVVVTGSAFALVWPDRLPLWLPAGLFTAAIFTLDDVQPDHRNHIPLAVLASALAALRVELAPASVVLLVAAWRIGRRPLRQDLGRVSALAGIVGLVVASYMVARTTAWSEVDAAARVLVQPPRGSALVRLVLSLAIGLAVVPALLLPLPRAAESGARPLRWLAFAAAAWIGGVAGKFTGERMFGARSLWILAIAAIVVFCTQVARHERNRLAFAIVVVVCVLVWEGRANPGRANWSWRYYELLHDVEYARHASAEGGDYAQVLASAPAGERVAVWVLRPELLDYARHEIVDLRTPRASKLRVPNGEDPRLARLLDASRARWLLWEVDDVYVGYRPGSSLHALLCPFGSQAPACTDALEQIAQQHRVVTKRHGVVLIDLRR